MKWLGFGIGAMLVGVGALWMWLPRGERPALGPTLGRLADCPDSPNCACSEASEPARRVDALAYRGDPVEAQRRLRELLDADAELHRVAERPGYLRYEAITQIWRFVDDVEFLLEPAGSRIQLRSASRIGHSDLGANRRRLERIRRRWTAVPE